MRYTDTMRRILLAGFAASTSWALACSSASTDVVGSSGGLDTPPDRDNESSSGVTSSSSSSSGTPQPHSGSSGSTSSSSGEPTPPECDALWSLTPPELVEGLPATALRPSFTADELTVYFVQIGGDEIWRIYAATRASRGEPFGAPVALGPNVNSGAHALAVWISDDGLQLYFNRYDGNPPQIFRVTRDSDAAGFGEPQLMRNNTISEFIARDGSARFFGRNANDGTHIYQLRPNDAAENTAMDLGLGMPTWYEPASGTLWLEQYDAPSERWYPRTMHYAGNAWQQGSLATDVHVYWTSVDRCRLYGTLPDNGGVFVRMRVPPP